ncbi:response regulator [Pseudomonas sp. Fl4BN1]|uniref:response regulator n=1 Tax=Pseudomonas sp. Fl4BN1 TaxID=2697651 RepID=UPI0013788E10|nr:response regulator [Pseudomonas sp. Fl4BN1]NBF08145.1 response regulator [Pseudomonas sp. Fl4BN1]
MQTEKKASNFFANVWFVWPCLLLVLCLTTTLVVLIADYRTRQKATSELDAELVRIAKVRFGQLQQRMADLHNNVLFLSKVPAVSGMARTSLAGGVDAKESDSYEAWKHQLEQLYSAYLETNPHYLQARLIGVANNGKELVRVEHKAGTVLVTPADQLQFKGDRDYFQASSKLRQGQVYTSEFNLNRELGKLELPIVPTVRVATPIYANDGSLFGIVVLNIDSNAILPQVGERLPDNYSAYIVNQEGDFLLHPDSARAFGFDLGKRYRWEDEFKAVSQSAPGEEGSVQNWISQVGSLLHVVQHDEVLGREGAERHLTVFTTVSNTAVIESVTSSRQITLFTMLVISGIAAGFLYLYGLSTRRQLQVMMEQRRLAAIVASSSDAIVGTTPQGFVLSWNEASESMFGYGEDEAVGRSLAELIGSPELLAEQMRLTAAIEHGEAVPHFATTRRRRDGTSVDVSIAISPVREADGKVTVVAQTIRDISQEKANESRILSLNANLEQQVAERTTQLLIAKERAEVASQAKSEFVANMSHEIRTPMNAVLGITHLLANTPLSTDQNKYLQMLRGAGESLLEILNDILDFSKIEAGHLEIVPVPFLLCDVLNALATIMSINAVNKDLELVIGVEPDVPQAFIGDALRIQQVLVNLVGNAIKFTEHGEVVVLVQQVGSEEGIVNVCFRVRDTGIGMTNEQQARLFSPFSQADTSITRRFGGTGLGLAISKRLVSLMSGTITMESSVGVGSEFQVTIPLRQNSSIEHIQQPQSALGDLRILVVDDNATSREYLCKTIFGWNWQADGVESGEQAAEQVSSLELHGEHYDAVIVDWQMPGLNGLETMREIRRILPTYTQPIIIMVNAFDQGKLMQEPASAEIDSVLIKPVTSSNLFDTLHEALTARIDPQVSIQFKSENLSSSLPLDGVLLLLVEDNSLNQFVATNILEQAGAIVEVASDGQQAVDRLRADPQRYQVVLMDVQMPVMDGFSATRVIRNELQLALPILAMTAGVFESEREQCVTAGMDGFIAKPIDVKQMLSTIRQHVPTITHASTTPTAMTSTPSVDDLLAFDVGPLLALAKNDKAYFDTLITLIQRAVEDGVAPITKARIAWQEGRSRDAASLFHTLRGTLGTLGARRFAEKSLQIELAINGNDRARADELFDVITLDLEETLTAAKQWIAQQEVSETNEDTSENWDPSQITEFHLLLQQQSLDACELYNALRSSFLLKLGHDLAKELDAAMERLDFQTALACIQSTLSAADSIANSRAG